MAVFQTQKIAVHHARLMNGIGKPTPGNSRCGRSAEAVVGTRQEEAKRLEREHLVLVCRAMFIFACNLLLFLGMSIRLLLKLTLYRLSVSMSSLERLGLTQISVIHFSLKIK